MARDTGSGARAGPPDPRGGLDRPRMGRHRSTFPLARALGLSLRSMRIRLGRMILVFAGVVSAIAFTSTLTGMNAIFSRMERTVLAAEPAQEPAADDSLLSDADEEATSAGMGAMRNWWIVIGLLICLVGITNAIMLSVTERTKEIGTIKCLGAMNYHVVEIFLFEVFFLGTLGGFVGGVVGSGLSIVNAASQWGGKFWELFGARALILMALKTVAMSTLVAGILCVIACIYPVYCAARLEPAEAMRREV